jgi:hypothetical protein
VVVAAAVVVVAAGTVAVLSPQAARSNPNTSMRSTRQLRLFIEVLLSNIAIKVRFYKTGSDFG